MTQGESVREEVGRGISRPPGTLGPIGPAGAPAASSWSSLPAVASVEDVARWLGLGERGARKLLERGDLPSFKLGKRWFCRVADVEAALQRKIQEASEERTASEDLALRTLRGIASRRRGKAS